MEKEIIQKAGRYFSIPGLHNLIKEYLSSGDSKGSIWKKYTGQRDQGLLLRWMRQLGYDNPVNPTDCIIAPNTEEMSRKALTEQEFERLQLEKRIAGLEKQLKEAELKAIAFSTMVDIAEKEFRTPIRKKYNTKPWKQ